MFATFIASPVCRSAHAFANIPSDFCLRTSTFITWSGGGTQTNLPVRYQWNTQALISQTGMRDTGWDIRPVIGSFSNEIFIEMQDINAADTTVWVIVPTINNDQTLTLTTYSGSNTQFRDSGVYMSGGEFLTTPDDNTLDSSGVGNLQIDLWLDVNNETPRDQTILDKHDGTQGYKVQFADIASVLNLQFLIDNGSCSVAWNTLWANERNKFTFVYANSTAGVDALIHVNDVLQASCDIDQGPVAASVRDLTIGGDSSGTTPELEGLALQTVTIFDNTTRILKYVFNPEDVSEVGITNPFTGTIADRSGNGFTLAYTYDRDQTGIAALIQPSQLVDTTLSSQVIQEITPIGVLGQLIPFDPGFSTKTTDSFLYTWFVEPLEGIGPSDWVGPTMAFTGIGLVIGIAFFLATDREFSPLSVFLTAFPISISGAAGWTPWWYIFMWWAILITTWWGARRAMQSSS